MKAIQTKLDHGGTVLIQVDDAPEILHAQSSGGSAAGFTDPKELLSKLDHVAQTITDTCKTLFQRISTGFDQNRPDELELEFGVTLGGEAGVPFVTKGTVEAAFKVTATWKFEKPPQPPKP